MTQNKTEVLTWTCPVKGCGKVISSLYTAQLENNIQTHKLKHKRENTEEK